MDVQRRFCGRSDDYARYRPSYPSEVIDLLRRHDLLRPSDVVADVGSGTGIWTALLLEHVARVCAIEPNAEMRAVAEAELGVRKGFVSVAGSAENTGLAESSVDAITSAQAFHWFDLERARAEFIRIMQPGGHAILLWNQRRTRGTAFLEAFEALLNEFSIDYGDVKRKEPRAEALGRFFGSEPESVTLLNRQVVDAEGLAGRLRSMSYVPPRGHERYPEMMRRLDAIFEQCQTHGRVTIEYDTLVYFGRLAI